MLQHIFVIPPSIILNLILYNFNVHIHRTTYNPLIIYMNGICITSQKSRILSNPNGHPCSAHDVIVLDFINNIFIQKRIHI